jgi:hypothetical protein
MDADERHEVREMIHGILSGWEAATIARDDVTNANLTGIKERLDRINGTVARHETVISENLPHDIANCPQADTIQEIRDNMITDTSVLKYKEKSGNFIIAIVSIIIAVISCTSVFIIPACQRKAELAKQKEESFEDLLKKYNGNTRGAVIHFDSTLHASNSDTIK